MNPHISIKGLSYAYEEDAPLAVKDFSLDIEQGQFVALLGHNGSGKSTVAKLLNGLYRPTKGQVLVSGLDSQDPKNTWEIRRRCGLVFQNPDNQIVASVVQDDVAFGLENIGLPPKEMPARIEEALKAVHMSEFADRAPHLLSGGQKQRVAIAGILAMRPEALVLDEATAMLDPSGRQEVLKTVKQLNRERNITVVWITHFMEEAVEADRVAVMYKGELVMDGSPREVFAKVDEVRGYRLDVPPMARLAQMLVAEGLDVRQDALSIDDMLEEVKRLVHPA